MSAPLDGWTCARGFEAALAAELGARSPVVLGPGAVSSAVSSAVSPAQQDPIFARQVLPAAQRIEGASVNELAQAAFDALAAPIDAPGPWVLHVWDATADDASLATAGRAALVLRALVERIERLRRRASRRRVVDLATAWPGPAPLVAQVALVERGLALVSAAPAVPLPGGAPWPDPRWPGGWRRVDDDQRQAPSSAYRKAEEAYLLLGRAPAAGERVVDLGGSPGGWTWTALRRGAHVLAVDRAPLAAPCAGHPALEERRGDALAWEPERPVDWLLCDVITAPERTIELLDQWLAARRCRRFVVNVKFKGDERATALATLTRVLEARGAVARTKHLVHDKNEVTTFGSLPDGP